MGSVGEHEGEPSSARGGFAELDRVERGGPQQVASVLDRAVDVVDRVEEGRASRDVDVAVRGLERHPHGQELGEGGGQFAHGCRAQQLVGVESGREVHARADGQVVVDLDDAEGAVGAARPLDGRTAPCAARADHDRIGDHEAAEQADAELAQVIAAGKVEDVALRAASDRGEQIAHLVGVQAHSVVSQHELAGVVRQRGDADASALAVDLAARRDGVARVLQQLAQIHAWARVDVAAQEVDDTAQVHLELLHVSAHCAPPFRPLAEPNNNDESGPGSAPTERCRMLDQQLLSAFFRRAPVLPVGQRWQDGDDTPRPPGL